MFEHHKVEAPHGVQIKPVSVSSPNNVKRETIPPYSAPKVGAFTKLYIKVIRGVEWNNEELAAGRSLEPHLPRYRALEHNMDKAWAALTDQERAEALRALYAAGEIDGQILEIMATFGAVPTSVTQPKIADIPRGGVRK